MSKPRTGKGGKYLPYLRDADLINLYSMYKAKVNLSNMQHYSEGTGTIR